MAYVAEITVLLFVIALCSIAILFVRSHKSSYSVFLTETSRPKSQTDLQRQVTDVAGKIYKNVPYIITGRVTKIIDGDTLEIDGKRIRLAIVDTPEWNECGGSEATEFVHNVCPVGSMASYKIDREQYTDSHGRIVAKVWCNPVAVDPSLNEQLVVEGHGKLLPHYQAKSEFGHERWAKL